MNEFLRGRPMDRLELPNFKPAFVPESEEAQTEKRKVIPNPGYQTLPVEQGFDLRKLFSIIREDNGLPHEYECYMVAFRSRRRPGEINEDLENLLGVRDAQAQASAEGKGLLHYGPGEPNEDGVNLTLCIWESREAALAVTTQQAHREAAEMADKVYEDYSIERYRMRRKADGSITLINAMTNELYAQIV